jgi:kynureninase
MSNTLTANDPTQFQAGEAFAREMDSKDSLAKFRAQFLFPQAESGEDVIYFAGNSLGLQPRKAKEYINEELEDWAKMAVEGHWAARHPWLPYHEFLTAQTARLVGAEEDEVVVMNTLTVNLHLMMVSFYRPTKTRYKILIEGNAFPSDQYAVKSQARLHGFDPSDAVIELKARAGEQIFAGEDILAQIDNGGDQIALVLLGDVNYLTGQAFDVEAIARKCRERGCNFGLNLAHGAGNLLLKLHDWDVDFAVWCSYKYLNSGPGGLAGCFVHRRHLGQKDIPRFEGWWGHDKASRFQMGPDFNPIPTVEAWQLSNPPIFQLAALRASMELFDEATMPALRTKSEALTGYLAYLLNRVPNQFCRIVTPESPGERGCQLSVRVKANPKELQGKLAAGGAICDFREPDIIRVAPVPLYCRFVDVYKFATALGEHAK